RGARLDLDRDRKILLREVLLDAGQDLLVHHHRPQVDERERELLLEQREQSLLGHQAEPDQGRAQELAALLLLGDAAGKGVLGDQLLLEQQIAESLVVSGHGSSGNRWRPWYRHACAPR